jgi:hypothetical protein
MIMPSNSGVNTTEGYGMEINPKLIKTAEDIVSNDTKLPAEIPGFEGFFVANAGDDSVDTVAAFVWEKLSYKIGTKSRQ